MPGKETHKYVGAAAGVALAAFEAHGQPKNYFLIEMLGGALGGMAGGMAPDWLEPAVSSWHRGVCHSASAGVSCIVYVQQFLANLADACRKNAAQCRVVPQVEDVHTGQWIPIKRTPLQQAWAEIGEFIWTLLAGFLNGLTAGYVSHLVLDATTPRGIPLLAGRASLKL
jgi:LexA-binding, inner membrane-associated putative hydrolase